ncbi:MAG: sortase [Candidatus Jorgensenbacteria bacterium]|nr:sortase [Candidatus Jorgensenbacteria bacterium]
MKVLNTAWFIALLLCVSVVLKSASAAADFTFTRNLSLGIRGDDVSALQQFLIAGGFLKILTPTGYFGPLTTTALGAWQTSVSIYPPAGFFGPISRGKINTVAQQAPISATLAKDAVGTTTIIAETTSTAVVNIIDGSPVRLKIPKLNIDAGFQYNGLKSDGTMEIPNNVTDVGWFTGSPRPGEKGSSIVTGHVAQIRGGIMTKPGVFSNLSELKIGDKLYVLNDKGESIAFVVRESRVYDPTADATDIFTPGDGGIHLNLITCEGSWNPEKLSYTQRLVVFTDAVQ